MERTTKTCSHTMAVFLPTADGWCRYCEPLSGGCSLTAFGETMDDAREAFRQKNLSLKLQAIQKKKNAGQSLSYEEHRWLQYSNPMSCSSCRMGY